MYGWGYLFFFSSRRRHTRYWRDWSSDVCSSDLEQRRRVGHVLVLALLEGRLDVLEARVGEGQRHRAAEVLDRADLLEDLGEAADGGLLLLGREGGPPLGAADEPVERGGLQREQVRHLEEIGRAHV